MTDVEKAMLQPRILDDFRSFMSGFCTGVTVVASTDLAGQPHGLTCTSLTSITLRPPTLLVCLDTNSGTLAAVRESGTFAVNLLHENARRTAELFASRTPNRFDQVAWQRTEVIEQLWLVEDAFALAECVVAQLVLMGDHVAVFGRVVNVEHAEHTPLLYGMRTYSRWCATQPTSVAPT